jgi:hypothetical protein
MRASQSLRSIGVEGELRGRSPTGDRSRRSAAARAFVAGLCAAVVLWSGRALADPNEPILLDPPEESELRTSRAYVRVEVLAGEFFEVCSKPRGNLPRR